MSDHELPAWRADGLPPELEAKMLMTSKVATTDVIELGSTAARALWAENSQGGQSRLETIRNRTDVPLIYGPL